MVKQSSKNHAQLTSDVIVFCKLLKHISQISALWIKAKQFQLNVQS